MIGNAAMLWSFLSFFWFFFLNTFVLIKHKSCLNKNPKDSLKINQEFWGNKEEKKVKIVNKKKIKKKKTYTKALFVLHSI